ncbi:MAG: tetratricopeptide repeat protein [Bdellovibrionales bacterium]
MKLWILVLTLISLNLQASDFVDKIKSVGGFNASEANTKKIESLIYLNEKKAMSQIDKLLRKYRGTGMEAGLLFRKAELYMRAAKVERFFEFQAGNAKKMKMDRSSKQSVKKAIKIYTGIAKKYKDFHSLDMVHFNMAFAYQRLGKEKTALSNYKKVTNNFPDSPVVPEAYLATGEIYFNLKKFNSSAESFEAIKNYKNSPVLLYGKYKLAWARYNLNTTKIAINELVEVVNMSRLLEGDRKRLDLSSEALTDLVLFYGDIYPPESAVAFFKPLAKEKTGEFVYRLSRLYNRHSKLEDEQKLYYSVYKELPLDPKLPNFSNSIFKTFEDTKQTGKTISALNRLDDLCLLDSSWGKKNAGTLDDCSEIISAWTTRLSNKWHKKWSKLKTPKVFEQARVAYSIRERRFPKDFKSLNNYANLLFQNKMFRDASDMYFKSALVAKGKKSIHDISYSAIFSFQKSINDKWQEKDEDRYLELANLYIGKNPKGKYVEDVEFKRVYIIYERGRFEEAMPLFKELGRKYAHKSQGVKAQDVYMSLLGKFEKDKLLADYSKDLASKAKLKKRKQYLTKIYNDSYFTYLSKDSVLGQKTKAKAYLNFAKTTTDVELAEDSYWNALVLFEKSKDYSLLSKNLPEYFKKHNKRQKEALLLAYRVYIVKDQLALAVGIANSLSKVDKENSKAWIVETGGLYRALGNSQKAFKIHMRLLNKMKDRSSGQLELARRLKVDAGKNKALLKEINQVILDKNLEPMSTEILYSWAANNFRKNKFPKAFTQAGKVLKQKLESSKPFRAKARLIQAKILADEFHKQSVKTRASRLETVVAMKLEKFEKAQKALESSIRYGYKEIAIDAYISLVKLYNGLEADFDKFSVKDATPEEVDGLKKELKGMIQPLLTKRLEFQESLADLVVEGIPIDLSESNKSLLSKWGMKSKTQKIDSKPEKGKDTELGVYFPEVDNV